MSEFPTEFDPGALALLRRVGQETLVARMISMFAANGPRKLDTMRAALDTNDLGAVGRAAHSLKSSAGQLGATRLHQTLASIEADALAGADADRLRAAIDAAAHDLARALAWLNDQTSKR